MKERTLVAGFLGAALMLSPLLASAASVAVGGAGGSGGGAAAAGAGSTSGTQDQLKTQTQDPTTHTGDEPLQTQDQTRLYTSTTSTSTGSGSMNQEQSQGSGNAMSQGEGVMNQEQTQYQLMIEPEHLQVQARAGTSAELGQMIQVREQELAQEAASTTVANRSALQNANQVRLAVHAFLSAQDLLPGIGQQVAAIATQLDNSVQASANAEVQIQSRGFWTRLFFGGDAQAAGILEQQVTQNQVQLQTLTQLLSQASSTPAVQAQLQAQLQTMQEEQSRLQDLSKSEKSQWGLFSWRF